VPEVDSLVKNFGPIIAFGLPGFLVLIGLPPQVTSSMANLLNQPGQPSLEGFLYLLPASIGCGLIISAIRWVLIDTFLHWTGVRKPKLNFHSIPSKLEAFNLFFEHNYRFYQFYSNSLIAILILLAAHWRIDGRPSSECLGLIGLLCVVLVAASRDCLSRFYMRARVTLGEPHETQPSAGTAKRRNRRSRKR
jgi:hypothetical protein